MAIIWIMLMFVWHSDTQKVKYREKRTLWGDSGNKLVTEQCLYLTESSRLFHAGASSTNERTFVRLYRCRGVCRNGKYFWAGTALRQILFVTAGTLILQRSGKSARTIKKVTLCTKFGQLVLRKIIEIVATTDHILRLKLHQIRFPLGLRLRPRWGSLQRSPDP